MADKIEEENQKLSDQLMKLRTLTHKIDDVMKSSKHLDAKDLEAWYRQHLLLMVLDHLSGNLKLKIPMFMSEYDSCFGGQDIMHEIWKHLIVQKNADKDVLQAAADEVRQMLRTQMVPSHIDDQVSYWVISRK